MKIKLNKENAYVGEYCLEAQAEEIDGSDILNYFSTDELEELMNEWSKALRIGGRIILGGTDVFILSKNILNRKIELVDINKILYGSPNKSITSIESTKEFLTSLGFEISNILFDYDTCLYCVEAFKV